MSEIRVDVANLQRQIQSLNAAMKAADPKMRRQMMKAMRGVAEKIKAEQQDTVVSLPAHGGKSTGLRQAAALSLAITVRGTGKRTGVEIRSRKAVMPDGKGKLPRYMDRGSWRHPVYGGKTWVTQSTPPGWFLGTGAKMRPEAVRELSDVVQRFWYAFAASQR